MEEEISDEIVNRLLKRVMEIEERADKGKTTRQEDIMKLLDEVLSERTN